MAAAPASNYNSQLEQLVIRMAEIICNIELDRKNYAKKVHDFKPDTYAGTEDPVELENWIRQIEKILEAVECPEDQKVSRAAFYLKGEADYWWADAQEGLRAQPNFNWEAFKTALRSRFYMPHMRSKKYEEFINLEQGNDSVTDYYKKFVELWRCVDVMRDEKSKIKKFISGMHFDLRGLMIKGTYLTLHEAYDTAVEAAWLLEESESCGSEGGYDNMTRGNQNGGFKRFRQYNVQRRRFRQYNVQRR